MAECGLIDSCIFFNDKMANMPSTTEIFKSIYCRGEFNNCARMIIVKAMGRQNVPADLFPNQAEKAIDLINKG